MNDVVINAIQQKIMTPESLTFSSLRKLAGQDMNAQSSLNRGRAIIDCPTLLNQYLYSYGLMVQRQWNHVVPNIVEMLSDNNDQEIHLYDYGCGQGLATLLLIENTLGLQEEITQITLIEPSEIALTRAQGIFECKLPHLNIQTFAKELDDVEENHLNINTDNMNVHIFSNILDIEGFDQFKLFNKILATGGTHYLIAVSNDRNCYGGTARLESLYKALLNIEQDESLIISHTKFEHFSDEKNMNHVYFCLKIEIN
ncbi:MAG: hypothetical protein KBT36_07870 [Kurthia sp.]|nr:hypothetical protein [Candidatus Kurthia equi]